MDRHTIGFVNRQRLTLHQEIMLLVIHFKNADLIILVIQCHKVFVVREHTDCLREFSLYRWDNTAARDAPRKEYDHAMDDVRYFVSTVLAHEEDGFFALAMSR